MKRDPRPSRAIPLAATRRARTRSDLAGAALALLLLPLLTAIASGEGAPPVITPPEIASAEEAPPVDTPPGPTGGVIPATGGRETGTEDEPRIQLALLLDTSNSMDGLIHQAKARLWKVVNEFLFAERDGRAPRLEVALYEYGNDALGAESSWVRRVTGFTDDLDLVSRELFALDTDGGKEYCGTVIERAIEDLAWSDDPRDLGILFIAGNEPFDQGPIDFRRSCRKAIERGVLVNTVFCGPEAEGIEGHWKLGALLADGGFSHIDSDRAVAHIAAPQDERIRELGERLNETYVPYGKKGRENWLNQAEQDANAARVAEGSAVQRMVCKSSGLYRNDAWDLVDAVAAERVDLAEIAPEELPEAMREMTPEERRAHVQSKAAARKRLQEEIRALDAERREYVARQRRAEALAGADPTLDEAMSRCIREQAARVGIGLEAEPKGDTAPPRDASSQAPPPAGEPAGEGKKDAHP